MDNYNEDTIRTLREQLTARNFADSMVSEQANDEFMRWRMNPQDIIDESERLLRCLVWDAEQKVFIRQPESVPVMNEQGILEILSALRALLNRNTFLGSRDKDEIARRMRFIYTSINSHIYHNYERFNIDIDRIPFVIHNIMEVIESAYIRSLLGKESRDISTSIKEIHSFNTAENRARKSSLPGWVPFFGGKK